VTPVPSRRVEHGVEGELAPPAAPARAPIGHLREVDALRGIAILLVFCYHCDSVVRPDARGAGPLFAFVRAGHTGVSLFFVLSGFLLAMPFIAEAEGGRHVRRREYALRRAMRILPMYYLALLVALGWSTPIAQWASSWPFLVFLNPLAGPYALWPFSIGWWSLATEVQFYVLLPLIALAFGRSRRVTLALLAGYAVAYLAVATGLVLPGIEPWLRAQSVVGRGPLFLCGILAAWFYRRHGDAVRTRLAASRPLAAGGADLFLAVVFVALAFLLRWVNRSGFFPIEESQWYVWHVPEGALWTVVLLIVLLAPLRLKAVLSNRVLAWLGVLSYSIYLLHQPLLYYSVGVARRPFPGMTGWSPSAMLWFAVITAVCVGLASLTYRFIERPFLVRKARIDGAVRPAEARAA
jgi:peptidoglycan/LPS O-acetylase OafA/YrhL